MLMENKISVGTEASLGAGLLNIAEPASIDPLEVIEFFSRSKWHDGILPRAMAKLGNGGEEFRKKLNFLIFQMG